MADKLPQRSRSHEVDEVAIGSFLSKKPRQWVSNQPQHDYGWDFLITIENLPGRVGQDFFVQLKSSESVNYLRESEELSHPIEVKTVNWLLSKPIPTMFAVCDVATDDNPIYWIWLNEAVEKLKQSNPSWKTQYTVQLRIPLANKFSTGCFPAIEQYVKDWHEERRFAEEVIRAIGSSSPAPVPLEGQRSENIFQLKREVFSNLRKVGLAEISETEAGIRTEIYGPIDLETRKKIQEAATLLDALQDAPSRRLLDGLEDKIAEAPAGIKAMYINCRGALALHEGKDAEALQKFREALALNPRQEKYADNVLTLEYKIAIDEETDLPSDWDDRLNARLLESPDSAPAIRLKSMRLAVLEGWREAEKYLESTSFWRDHKQDALTMFAEILKDNGQIDHAIELISQAEAIPGGEDNPFLFSLKGNLFLYKAIGINEHNKGLTIRGLGPANLDIKKLHRSTEAYLRACNLFARRGYPLIAEQTFSNATTVMVLLGNYSIAETLARSFIDFHHDNRQLHAALAMALYHKGEPICAMPYAQKSFEQDPNVSQNYINLLIILLQAEDYDSLLNVASNRQEEGFRDSHEECSTRVFVAVAYAEKGMFEQANSQVEILINKQEFYADGVVAEAAVSKRRGLENRDIAAQIRDRLRNAPNDPTVLTILVQYLLPPTKDTADEVVRYLKRLTEIRQLAPEEIFALGRAHLIQESLEDAEIVFRSGRLRYPNDARFLVELSHVLSTKGEDEAAYEVMSGYLKFTDRDPRKYWNFGMLARATDRLDEAINMFQKALTRERDPSALRKLHAVLFDAKRRRGDSPKVLLQHVMAFGELAKNEPEEEGRFLVMALITPLRENDLNDPKIKAWKEGTSLRLEAYVTAHPKSKLLRRFSIPESVPEEQKGLHILSQIMAFQLPQHLVASQVELSARGTPWPLSFRKDYMGYGRSIFHYWEYCTSSRDFANSIHIWYDAMDFDQEMTSINFRRPVCVDLTALLTLLSLDLLSEIFTLFPEIVLARGTIHAIREEFLNFGPRHPHAVALDKFIKENRRKIRIRPGYGVPDMEASSGQGYLWTGTIWAQRDRSSMEMIHDGIGETVVVASQSELPLYCDDVYVRICAKNECQMSTFSTLALLARLRVLQRLTIDNESDCLVKLINLNYRHVRFTAQHLHHRLRSIVQSSLRTSNKIIANGLNADNVLGVLLRQFGDREINDLSLLRVACEWWIILFRDTAIPDEILETVIETLTFKLSQRRLENVLEGVSRDTLHRRIALVWVFLLLRLYVTRQEDTIPKAWSILKSCAEKMLGYDEKKFNHLVWEILPDALYQVIMSSREVDDDKKTIALVNIPQKFGTEDCKRFEDRISRHLFKT